MKKIMFTLAVLLGFCLLAQEVDAKRLGGGSSIGRQRSTIAPPAPRTPAEQAPAATPATPAQQPSGLSRWLGPLAGLALGAGLASLFLNNGAAGLLLIALLIAAAVFALRLLRRPQQEPLQYAGASAGTESAFRPVFGGASAPTANRFPPGFDAVQFARHAKLNFMRLQMANDQRDLSVMRDFMTPALYSEIDAQLNARDAAPQKTEVVALDAEVVDVATEGDHHIASVRFRGTIRETADSAIEPFSEVWHLEKPLNGATGWLLSGIQQD